MQDVTLAPRSSTPSPALVGAYAHLRRGTSVLVTGWERLGADEFGVGVRWPAVQVGLPYDPRILAQTIRQSGLVVAHAEYGVPLTHQTVLSTLDYTIDPDFRVPRGRSARLDVRVTVAGAVRNRRPVSSLRMGILIRCDGVVAARADSEFGWISPAAYRRVRGNGLGVGWGAWPLPEPIAADLVARPRASDVALAPGDRPHRWLLRNDIDNHLLFDHPVDHVPGLALLEAAAQAAQALRGRSSFLPLRVATSFRRYVEFDRPCWIEAEETPAGHPARCAVRVTGTQGGEPAFRVEFNGLRR
ncbi:A-factor biosynthesis protein [Kitasatospora sp. NBC_01246]|uniref:ScbA/BarX family gamma-butyrolactone biosynthesis protein n=1 Tax=Kitasatospora sp. NBC_01246 TaxID=2903570 RepID=UPI002E33AEAB|nr:ScbA/BarX family gamma-butyrolactone biosynthesis protein [Kitasatospora sp. NBC_01246]